MNHEELETLGPLKLETYVRIRRYRETAEVDFLTQVDDSLVPPFHEDETLNDEKTGSYPCRRFGDVPCRWPAEVKADGSGSILERGVNLNIHNKPIWKDRREFRDVFPLCLGSTK